ncbi:MAG: ABC transporter ATP-binding protein [Alphaproteobacteria bacterium]|nr:ABC transporter ATP-binding protein [Alphaproteobacteria bacterium]MBN2779918.1 ABC transporter ATP-binding protein [Alphaproteobacteria bacterium]
MPLKFFKVILVAMAKSFSLTRHDIALFKRLWHLSLKIYFPTILLAVVFMLISSGGEAYVLSLLKPLFDEAFMDQNYQALGLISMQVIGVFFLKSGSLYAHTYLMGVVGLKATKEIQIRMFKKFLSMDMSFFGRKSFGILQTHFGSDATAPTAFLESFFTRFMKDIFTILFMVGLMVYEAPQLSLIILVLLPAISLPLAKFGKRYRSVFGQALEKTEEFGTYFHQILQSIPIVKIYVKERKETERATEYLDQIYRLSKKNLRVASRVRPTMETLGGIAMGGALLLGGYQITAGLLTTGQFVTFLSALFGSYRPLKSISGTFVQMQAAMKNTERLFSILDEKSKIQDKKNAKVLAGKKLGLTFENVTFGYEADKPVIKNMSLEVKPGQTVALVGTSGGGKSTIVGLIPRFYDVDEGAVKINGQNIKNFTMQSLRKHMAYVTQDTMLFEGSIAENIAYGATGKVSRKDIIKAAKYAAADEFIEGFEKGYDQPVGERGGRLSGGQKQRISIARALLKDAPILLLDEATSALDTKSESIVQKALQTLMKNRTTIVIAHRLSTIINADKIVVVDNGMVVEEGTHEALLKKNGYYAKLYQMQLKKKAS